LDKEQTGYLGRLEVGWAAVKLQGRWFFPFLVKVPLIEINKGSVTDQALRDRASKLQPALRGLYSGPGSISEPISPYPAISEPDNSQDGQMRPFPCVGKEEKLGRKREISKRRKQCAIKLTTQEKDFLWDIWHYACGVTDRYRRLGFSFGFGNSLKNSLIQRGLIYQISLAFNHSTVKLLSLREKGKKYIGVDEKQSDRHGGPVHKFWVETLAKHLQAKGFYVQKEVPVGGGKTVDIVAMRNGRKTAFEIETGKSDATANLNKCIGAGFQRIVVAATSARVRDRLRLTLPGYAGVEVQVASELLQGNEGAC
jgi:hypothetical protein